ncbi:MAG: hypothetical protein Kow0029_11950 [Candidatus Rifleibacteriota bacterium]
MPDNKHNNKRLVMGAIILTVLLVANFLVRLNRKPIARPSVSQPAAAGKQDIMSDNHLYSANSQTSSTQPFQVNLDTQLTQLREIISNIQERLRNIEKPIPAPDNSVALFLRRKNLFKSSEKEPAATAVASETLPSIASTSELLEIIGSFKVKGLTKLLVKKGNKAYLVEEQAMISQAEISLLTSAGDEHRLIDKNGIEYVLKLKKPNDKNLQNIVKLLKGVDTQPEFALINIASLTDEVNP